MVSRRPEGIAELQRGLADHQMTGAKLWRAHFLGLLADALAGVGRVDEGLSAVQEALALVQLMSDNASSAELERIHGEILISQATSVPGGISPSAASRADACFKRARTIAQEQQAKSWELRIARSQGRLYRQQDESSEARRVVQETYAWFTEGHETADLKAARSLMTV